MKKIVLFGDSLLKGVLYDEASQRYISIGKKKCEEIGTQNNVEIVSMAKFGMTAKRAYETGLHNRIPDCDLVIIGLGGNDCNFNWKEISDNPEDEHYNNSTSSEYKDAMIGILTDLKARNINTAILSLPPISSEKYFNWFSKNLNKINLKNWITDINIIYQMQEYYNTINKNVAKDLGVPILDVRSICLINRDYSQMLECDGIHLKEAGYDFLGASIVACVKSNSLI